MTPKPSGIWTIDEASLQHLSSPTLAKALSEVFSGNAPIVDLGCGMGSYALLLEENGFDVSAYDGTPDLDSISVFHPIQELDLTEPFSFEERSDILCLEVGEHIHPEHEQQFLDRLVRNAKNRIILSWAIPGQGGNGHVNELSNDYIIEQMKKRGAIYNSHCSLYLRSTMKGDDLWWFENTLMVFDTTPHPMIGCSIIALNEENTIGRAIKSVLPHIDVLGINIAGTTDGTKETIAGTVPSGIRCKVIEPHWKGAADALNQAADECEKMGADWVLRMDADCILRDDLPNFREVDEAVDGINMKYFNPGESEMGKYICYRTWIYRPHRAIYKGVRHEGLFFSGALINSHTGTYYHYDDSGARPRVKATYMGDAVAMKEALLTETDPAMVTRYTFYIANSLRDAGEETEALLWYRMRSQMGGFDDEAALALLHCATKTHDQVDYREGLIRFNDRPDVAFWALENAYYSDNEEWMKEVLGYTKNANWKGHAMFCDPSYVWKCLDYVALCMMKLRDGECLSRWEILLRSNDVPEDDRLRIEETYLKTVPVFDTTEGEMLK